MGNAHTGGAGGAVEIDDDLLTRAGELLAEARDMSARKRTREEDLPAPAPMFSMPKPTGSERAGKDEYTSAVLSAATAYLNSGGKACKPIEAASAGSIGRKTTINVVEASDSSVDTESELVATPPLAVAEGSEADKAPAPAARLVVYKCRACGCGKRDHECHPTARAPTSSPAAGAAPATGGDQRLRPWTPAEDQVICSGVQELGFKWSTIASRLDRRTDNAVRNRWHRLEAARKWRAELEMCGEDKLMHGYKCGRCGQPKRGHTCPFNAPPLAPPNFEPAPIAVQSVGPVDAGAHAIPPPTGLLDTTPSGRLDLESLQRLIAEAPSLGDASQTAGAAATVPSTLGAPQMLAPPPPAELPRNNSSIERLLQLSRDFSLSWLRSLSPAAPPPPAVPSLSHAQMAALASSHAPQVPFQPAPRASTARSAMPPPPPGATPLLLHPDVPALGSRGATASGSANDTDADSIVRDLQAAINGACPTPQAVPATSAPLSFHPPPLQRTPSSIEKVLSIGRELSMSFIADALGLGSPSRTGLNRQASFGRSGSFGFGTLGGGGGQSGR
mmetsp:Transcript_13294/g.32258  ORF Transcript_13294/g.32258 Transcript_13294/m.32258 type:complete len:560 (+) Transcript_13294:129-1808(+)